MLSAIKNGIDTELKFQLFLPLVVEGMSCVYPLHYYFYLRTLYCVYPCPSFFPPLYCVYHYSSYFYLVCTVFTPILFYFYLLCTVFTSICPIFISYVLCFPPSVLFLSPLYCIYPYLSYFIFSVLCLPLSVIFLTPFYSV